MENGKSIDLSKFNLVYKRKSDGRFFLCRMILRTDFEIIDCVTGLVIKITSARLRRWYEPVRAINKKNKKTMPAMNYRNWN